MRMHFFLASTFIETHKNSCKAISTKSNFRRHFLAHPMTPTTKRAQKKSRLKTETHAKHSEVPSQQEHATKWVEVSIIYKLAEEMRYNTSISQNNPQIRQMLHCSRTHLITRSIFTTLKGMVHTREGRKILTK